MDPVEAIILEPGTIGETTAVSKKQSKMEQLELVDSDDKADTVEEEVLAEAPKDRVKGSIYMQEFDEQCARLMRVDRFASGHIWIASTFTLSEYTLQRETGVPPSIVKFSVSNADGQNDMRFTHWVGEANAQQYFHVPRLDGQMRISNCTQVRDVRFCHGPKHRPIRRIAHCAARVRSATTDHRRPNGHH